MCDHVVSFWHSRSGKRLSKPPQCRLKRLSFHIGSKTHHHQGKTSTCMSVSLHQILLTIFIAAYMNKIDNKKHQFPHQGNTFTFYVCFTTFTITYSIDCLLHEWMMILNEPYTYLCQLTAHRNLKQIIKDFNPYMAFETNFLSHKNGTTSEARRPRLTGVPMYCWIASCVCFDHLKSSWSVQCYLLHQEMMCTRTVLD